MQNLKYNPRYIRMERQSIRLKTYEWTMNKYNIIVANEDSDEIWAVN